jgi:hypothetical protein
MRIERRTLHRLLRTLLLIAFAAFWMGVPRPPGPPGCRGPRPPRPPMPLHETPTPLPPY